MIELDLVIPIYNSAKSNELLVTALNNLVKENYFNLRVIFVNDASSDQNQNTLLNALKVAKFNHCYIRLSKNYGQHTATAIGLFYANAPFVATIDDDLQHNPNDLIKLHESLLHENADLIYGSFEEKKHHLLRNLGTKILQKILGSESQKYDLITSLRLMRQSTISSFKSKQTKHHFIDDYLLHASTKVVSCKIPHYERLHGKSGYSGSRLLSMAFLILFLHSSLPLKFISRMGVFLSLVFFLLGCYYIFQKLFYDVAIGFTSLIVAIFFSTGLIMFSLGVIGEYIRQIWVSNQELDKVLIAEICNN
jgi:polyisoprenyl-phosphate glycosyltransferase